MGAGRVRDRGIRALSGADSLVAIVPLLLVFLWQGSTEKAVTRGYMLQTAGGQVGAALAVVGSSVFFALLHLDVHPLALINITLYAVFASFVALEQGNLWLIAGIHAGWNYAQGNVFGLPVSGNPEASSLWSFGPAPGSHAVLTGSDFGLEASLIGTAVLVVATALALPRYRKAEARRALELAPPAPHLAHESTS